METLLWLMLTAVGIVGSYEFGKNLVNLFKDKDFESIFKAVLLLCFVAPAAKILALAKYPNDNEYIAALLLIILLGICHLGYGTLKKINLIDRVIEAVFKIKLEDEGKKNA